MTNFIRSARGSAASPNKRPSKRRQARNSTTTMATKPSIGTIAKIKTPIRQDQDPRPNNAKGNLPRHTRACATTSSYQQQERSTTTSTTAGVQNDRPPTTLRPLSKQERGYHPGKLKNLPRPPKQPTNQTTSTHVLADKLSG